MYELNNQIIFICLVFSCFVFTQSLIKKIYFEKVDPLIFVVLHSSLVVSAVLFEANQIGIDYIIAVLIMHLSFIFGLRISHSVAFKAAILKNKNLYATEINKRNLRNVMLTFCYLYIFYGLLIWANFGLLILAEDPEIYKLQFSTGGLGFIFRVMSSIIIPLFFFMYLTWKDLSLRTKIIPAITFLLALASTGKSVLIVFLTVALIAIVFKKLILGIDAGINYAKLIFFTAVALGFVLFTLYLAYGDALNSEGQLIFLTFFFDRISTAPGLGLITYILNNNYFDSLLKGDVISYVWNYLVVPIAAPLRLVEYVPTAGRELGIFITGAEDYGPNPTFYGEGLIYFGFFFGSLYTFIIGCTITLFRYIAVKSTKLLNPITGALVFVYFYYAILAITTDFLVFMSLITSYLFFFLLITAYYQIFKFIVKGAK